jgi:ankyrin repeat protein
MPTISLRQTPLQLAILNHMALQYQDAVLFVTKQLIEAGADPNVRDHDNTTALWLANHGHLPLVATYLKEHGAHE